MANKIRHLLHRRSLKSSPFTVNIERGSLVVQNPKAPLADNIEYGELAINYGKGHEGLFLRNSENEVIQLNTMKHIRYDGAVDTSFEKYLDDRFVNRSGDTMYGDFTITKEWDTDDPKFKYIGSYFSVSGTTIELSGDTMNVTENTVNTDIETGFTNIKEHKYEGINLDADVTNANWSGDTFHMIQDTKFKIDTDLFDLSGTTTNMSGDTLNVLYKNVNLSGTTDIDVVTPDFELSGGTANLHGTTLTVIYDNIDMTGNTDIDVVSHDIEIDTDLFDLSGTTTNMNGNTLTVVYDNVNLTGNTQIDVVSPDININKDEIIITKQGDDFSTSEVKVNVNSFKLTGNTTDMTGVDITINYTDEVNITCGTEVDLHTPIFDIEATTKMDITTPEFNLTGTTTNMSGDTLNVDYDNLHLSGITTLDIDADATTLDGCSLVVTETCNIDVVTPDFELSGGNAWLHGTELEVKYENIDIEGTTDIDVVTPDLGIIASSRIDIDTTIFDLSGTTTSMQGTLLDIDYTNIDLSGSTDIDIVSPKVNIDASTEVTISGTTEVQIDSSLIDINGTTTTMDGDTLTVNYTNIDLSGSTDIDITTPEFNLSGTTTNMEGDTLNVDYNNIHLSGITNLDIDANTTTLDGCSLVVTETCNIDVVTPELDIDADATTLDGCSLVVTETCNIDVVTPDFELSGGTANLHGTELEVKYENIDLSGTTDIDIVSPDIEIDTNLFDLSGTTTNLHGTKLYVDYDNIDFEASVDIDIISPIVDIDATTQVDITTPIYNLTGTTTNMQGDTLNINYKNIKVTAKTDDHYVDTTNFYGDVNISKNLTVSGDTNINGDTTIWGDLVLNPDKTFDGKLKYPLNFKIATSATKTNSATLIASVDALKYNNSNAENYITEIGSEDPLVTKGYIDDVFENILDDKKVTAAIDSFKELQEVLGVTNNGDITSTTYDTVVNGINAKVNRSGDTMTGNLNISTGVTLTTSGTITAKSDVTTNTKFIGKLDKTLTLNSGTFSSSSFNNSNDITVNIPTDISHLSCTGDPTSWTSLDKRYVNVSGDTMTGKLSISNGGLAVSGASTFNGDMSVTGTITASSAIYSSDKNLKENIKNINKYDIATVADVDLKSYKFIDDETHRERYGVIAQDLESVGLEHLVVKGENGKKGVDYISFLILKIAQLEKEIEELKKKK